MRKLGKASIGIIIGLVCSALFLALLIPAGPVATAPAVQAAEAEAETPPPADQEYTGVKRCASCHFEQYMKWKKSPHSKAFEILTAKYQSDEKCLKCHTTGYGEATGYKGAADEALASVTCESCHGPGSKHEEVCQPFAKVKELTPEQEKMLRDSIWKILPGNICIECHQVQAHKDSETPKELQEK